MWIPLHRHQGNTLRGPVEKIRAPAGATELPDRPTGPESVVELPAISDRLDESV